MSLLLRIFVALAASASLASAAPQLRPLQHLSSGEPTASAVGPGGTIYAGRGTFLRVFVPKGATWVQRHEVELSGCALEVVPSPHGVFVACGAQGLDHVPLEGARARAVPGIPGAVCVDVDTRGPYVYSLWAKAPRYFVQVNDARTLESVAREDFEGSAPRALAVDESRDVVFVALGTGGVERHSGILMGGGLTSVLGDVPLLDARDLVVAQGHLWIAAGQPGVLGVTTELPFGDEVRVSKRPIIDADRRLYAVRIATDGQVVAVGAQGLPGGVVDRVPFGLLGPHDVATGPTGPTLEAWAPLPKRQPISVFGIAAETGGLRPLKTVHARHTPLRSLSVGERLLVLQQLGKPVQVSRVPQPFVALSGAQGVAPVDALVLPGGDLALLGYDVRAARTVPAVAGLRSGALRPAPGAGPQGYSGSSFDAVWPGRNGNTIAVTGGWYTPAVVDLRTKTEIPLPLPPDASGARGHGRIETVAFGPFCAITRAASEDGLVVFRRVDLENWLGRGPVPEPVAVADTVGGDAPGAWKTRALRMGDSSWVLATATGARVVGGQPRMRMLLHRFDGERLLEVADVTGTRPGTRSTSVATFTVGRELHPYVVLAGIGGGLELYDVQTAAAPKLIAELRLPPDPWDGSPRSVFDCEVGLSPQQKPVLYAAMGRGGVACFDLERLIARKGPPSPDQVVPLPGWTVGIGLALGSGRVLACSREGGLTLLAEGAPKPGDPALEAGQR